MEISRNCPLPVLALSHSAIWTALCAQARKVIRLVPWQHQWLLRGITREVEETAQCQLNDWRGLPEGVRSRQPEGGHTDLDEVRVHRGKPIGGQMERFSVGPVPVLYEDVGRGNQGPEGFHSGLGLPVDQDTLLAHVVVQVQAAKFGRVVTRQKGPSPSSSLSEKHR